MEINNRKYNIDYSNVIWGAVTAAISLFFYVITLAPTLDFIDSGELGTACIQLGICHPTGYPLFTLLGKLFSLIIFTDRIYILNFMSALFSAMGIYVFYQLIVLWIRELNVNSSSFFIKIENPLFVKLIAASASLCVAFSSTYWDSANSIEVYNLHKFLIITVIYVFSKASIFTIKNKSENFSNERYWILFAFVLGLCFSNHLTSIFLSVGFIYLYFAVNGFNKISFQRILILGIPFVLGLSLYLYLFLRAEFANISWGYPNDIHNFIMHVSAKQFSVWMFTNTANAAKQFNHFLTYYPLEYYYVPLIVAVFGLIALFKFNVKIFTFTVLLFLFNILYAINYDIYDIDSYFLLAYIVTGIWVGFGILIFLKFINNKNSIIFYVLILALPLTVLVANYKENDESKNYFVKEYTENVFKSVRPNSIVISTQWDFFVSASWYYQYVYNYRKDVAVIDKELLRRSWYIREVQKHYPEIYEHSKVEFENYYAELLKFEENTPRYTNPKTKIDNDDLIKIRTSFNTLLNSIFDKNPDKNLYTSFEIEDIKEEKLGADFQKIPEGLLTRYSKAKTLDSNYTVVDLNYTISNNHSYHYEFLMKAYYRAYILVANYLMNLTRYDQAETILVKAAELEKLDIITPKGDVKRALNKIAQLKNANIQKN